MTIDYAFHQRAENMYSQAALIWLPADAQDSLALATVPAHHPSDETHDWGFCSKVA